VVMTANGVVKLAEECGELIQVCAKRLAYFHTDRHPDGSDLRSRMVAEIGDVLAAVQFVVAELHLPRDQIDDRRRYKLDRFYRWRADPDNNGAAFDAEVSTWT
jgi:NTP pyrophosphatase (non-canonical NTP hydrolase)